MLIAGSQRHFIVARGTGARILQALRRRGEDISSVEVYLRVWLTLDSLGLGRYSAPLCLLARV